jgi:acyl-CoA thioesterase
VPGVGNPFIDGTAVTAIGDGRYRGEIDPVWNLRPLPQGGIVTATALRAMAAELDNPDERLRTLHTTFVAQVADGPVDIDVDVLRRGRTMSHLRAEIRNQGAPRGHVTTAVFGSSRRGFEFTDLRPPADVPRPEGCRSFRDPPPPGVEVDFQPMRFWTERVEGRPVVGHAPWEEYEPTSSDRAAWHRFDEPPFLDDGTIDPLSLVVLVDTMPGAVGEMLGDRGDWFAPSIDLTVHLLDECRSGWVLAHNQARWAGDGYASADMALWDYGPEGDERPRLVAYATQLFLFSFPA